MPMRTTIAPRCVERSARTQAHPNAVNTYGPGAKVQAFISPQSGEIHRQLLGNRVAGAVPSPLSGRRDPVGERHPLPTGRGRTPGPHREATGRWAQEAAPSNETGSAEGADHVQPLGSEISGSGAHHGSSAAAGCRSYWGKGWACGGTGPGVIPAILVLSPRKSR